jgi:DnaJ homolog subfamily C member 2
MASIQTSPLPAGYKFNEASTSSTSTFREGKILPAGPAYLSHLRLTLQHNNSFEALDTHNEKERLRLQELQNQLSNGEDDLGVGDEPESEELLALDPKEWKVYFLYLISTISHLTYRNHRRNKITMQFWDCPIFVTGRRRSRLKLLVRFSAAFLLS